MQQAQQKDFGEGWSSVLGVTSPTSLFLMKTNLNYATGQMVKAESNGLLFNLSTVLRLHNSFENAVDCITRLEASNPFLILLAPM